MARRELIGVTENIETGFYINFRNLAYQVWRSQNGGRGGCISDRFSVGGGMYRDQALKMTDPMGLKWEIGLYDVEVKEENLIASVEFDSEVTPIKMQRKPIDFQLYQWLNMLQSLVNVA